MIRVRTGQAPAMLDRLTFGLRFRLAYADPLFETVADALERAGEGFDDPDFKPSSEWLATRRRLLQAQEKWDRPETPIRYRVRPARA